MKTENDIREMFIHAALVRGNMSFTDKELHDQILCLNVLVDYFEQRGDAKIIVCQLHLELEAFKSIQEARNRK